MTEPAAQHAEDVVLEAFVKRLEKMPGLEDHVTLDEDKIATVDELAWCWIQLGDSTITNTSLSGKKHRSAEVYVDLLTQARFGAMQQANMLAARIEDRIDADKTLGRVVAAAELLGVTRSRNDDASVARLRMNYRASFSTVAGVAGTPV